MTLTLTPDPLPIAHDGYGNIRVAGTRVTLSTILFSYLQGESPADIVDGFPTVPLSAVHAVIAYYLNHRQELDAYLREVEALQNELRRKAEGRVGRAELVERMRARQAVGNPSPAEVSP